MKVIVVECCLGFTLENEIENETRVSKFNELGLTGRYIKDNEEDDIEDILYYLDKKELELDDMQVLELLRLTNDSALTIEVSSGVIFCMWKYRYYNMFKRFGTIEDEPDEQNDNKYKIRVINEQRHIKTYTIDIR